MKLNIRKRKKISGFEYDKNNKEQTPVNIVFKDNNTEPLICGRCSSRLFNIKEKTKRLVFACYGCKNELKVMLRK